MHEMPPIFMLSAPCKNPLYLTHKPLRKIPVIVLYGGDSPLSQIRII